MAVSGISQNYYSTNNNYNYNGYSSLQNGLNSSSWSENANKEADAIKESLGIKDTDSTNKTSSTTSSSSSVSTSTASSTSGFLRGYQMVLEDLERASASLQTSNKDNVFAKYDAALAKANSGEEGASEAVTKAADGVYSAVKDFVNKYNSATSYLKNNGSFGSGLANQLESLKRGIPNEKTLKYLGMSLDVNGNLQVDEEAFKEALQKDPEMVKDLIGGQYSMADRVGAKASAILDSPVNKIIGSDADTSTSSSEKTSSSSSTTTYGYAKNSSTMSDSFMQFASFARSGAYNLSNYYAVSMLNILV